MDAPRKTFSELVALVKSWLPWASEPSNVSRDFWMPDQSCMVCYDCDSQFTIFNRRHHCRLCGLVFCAKCTANSVPAPSDVKGPPHEDWERIRVCNYCFKQRGTHDNGEQVYNLGLSTSPSATSYISTKSSGTAISSSLTNDSVPYTVGNYQRVQQSSCLSHQLSAMSTTSTDRQGEVVPRRSTDLVMDTGNPSSQVTFTLNRSDNEDDGYSVYLSDSETQHFPPDNDYYGQVDLDEISMDDGSHKLYHDGANMSPKSLGNSPSNHSFASPSLEGTPELRKNEHDAGDTCEASSSLYAAENVEAEPVDFENNGLLWLPPEPENEEDEKEAALFDDDDDDDDGDATGEWGNPRNSSSSGSGEYQDRDRSIEEQKKAMKNIVDGHFKALVAQLLQVENLPVGGDNGEEGWLETITSLSWEAATLLKPDMSKGGGMDPGGYVKVKCIASGHRYESMVVKGVVCKKNVAHRRMTSKIEKPRLLILGGALEYQRVSNQLSSFDTLLQQEMDHLKMAVAKIDAQHPDLLLVEKSVSRFAQEYLLGKDISLVLNIKRPLLERIARCTGAQIVPSIDHLSSQKLGYCEKFHVERFLEDLGTARQDGKKLVKTLMYFEGCPKPLGFTILLRGANGDELKKVKHVVQYGVFAAYHLAVETSFLADEGASLSLPEIPLLNSPITVALLDKPLSIERSISTVLTFPANEKPQEPQRSEPLRSNSLPTSELVSSIINGPFQKIEKTPPSCLPNAPSLDSTQPTLSSIDSPGLLSSALCKRVDRLEGKNEMEPRESLTVRNSEANSGLATRNCLTINDVGSLEALGGCSLISSDQKDHKATDANQLGGSEESSLQQDANSHPEELTLCEEAFPPSPSDHQSILVSLSSRCVWKGTVCERSHLFRIKYYGSFDKPLGRFLRDHLFDQSYQCHACDMPSEAHVHCYTHRQGTLTISVKKLPEILLPGEGDGKIWMWHRCLRCPRTNGFPPATRRIVMSDAAWGLSFGKFLELSFSNHAAASRVASCGHSLHRDCLRFYGFGNMVACFRYASIDVLSVYLPPAELDFDFENQEWIQKELDEVARRAEIIFSEVLNALRQIAEKKFSKAALVNAIKVPESRHQIIELDGMLKKEKAEFEESLQKALKKEARKGQPVIDILEINRLRRQLLFQIYMWDHRLIYTANLDNNSLRDGLCSEISEYKEKPLVNCDKVKETYMEAEPGKGSDSVVVDARLYDSSDHEGESDGGTNQYNAIQQESDTSEDSSGNEDQGNLSESRSMYDKSERVETGENVRRVLSEGQFPVTANLSDTLDAAWIGENHQATKILKNNSCSLSDSAVADPPSITTVIEGLELDDHAGDQNRLNVSPSLSTKASENLEDSVGWLRVPFLSFYRSLNKNFLTSDEKLDTLSEYHPAYLSSFRELELQVGPRLLLPVGVNDTVIPVYDDEPTSIISYALASSEYHLQINDDGEKPKDSVDLIASLPLFESVNFQSFNSVDETTLDSYRRCGSADGSLLSMSGYRSSLMLDPLSYTKDLHPRVSFEDDGPVGKVKYSVTCYHAKWFESLRRICCPSELDFIRSLSRCKKWGAQGGKSNVFFAKTLDDRFIIKQVTKTELESFMKFAPVYFKYLSESIGMGSPTCLAKILGIYQVTAKHLKGGKESRMDVLVMENLLFRRTVTRLYDLKGSSRSRYNPDSSGSNKVLLDQNLIEAMPTSPIFVSNKAKRLLGRAVWNDTSFLASIDVMDYSLLVGVDEEKHQLVLGIIDFMRQYTWDKHLETWVKASGILGGPKNASPTVISPKQYKKRFRKAMSTYFLMVPDHWSPALKPISISQSECEDNAQGGTSVE